MALLSPLLFPLSLSEGDGARDKDEGMSRLSLSLSLSLSLFFFLSLSNNTWYKVGFARAVVVAAAGAAAAPNLCVINNRLLSCCFCRRRCKWEGTSCPHAVPPPSMGLCAVTDHTHLTIYLCHKNHFVIEDRHY